MNIGLVINQLDPRAGGVEQWTCQFARSLSESGHEVHVVAERFSAEAQNLNIVCHPLPGARSRIEFAEQAERTLRSLPLDIVHDTGAGWHCDVFQPHGGARAASFEQNLLLMPRWRRPWKRRLASALPRYREFNQLSRRQYANDGRTVLALSQMVACDLEQFHGVRPDRIRIVYNGVDTDRFSPDREPEYRQAVRRQLKLWDEVLLLIVAHNFELKGVPTLLKAMGRLTAQGKRFHLAIAGGKKLKPYRRMAEACGAASAVTFLGPVDDPVPYYAAADIYVQPTFYDPCSLVVLEALASGLPVITSRYNGAGELLTSGREGYVVDDPSDVDELLDCLDRLADPSARVRSGHHARRLALDHTWEHNTQEIVSLYRQIAPGYRLAA
jgi:UDP-glucose:(heptosyl)LPS alpha-1,3-glucosyltransferase